MAKDVMLVALVAFGLWYLALASDPRTLQEFCVADVTSFERVNGHACKDHKDAQASDFFFSGQHMAGNTSNALGFTPTLVNAEKLVGLNTLGISMAHLDFAPYEVNPPHIHPRATELLLVTEGSLEVVFVTSDPDNRHISKVLQKGEVFVFPVGFVHYHRNVNNESVVAIVGLSSQNPGVISIPNAVFASHPKTNPYIITKDSDDCLTVCLLALLPFIGFFF